MIKIKEKLNNIIQLKFSKIYNFNSILSASAVAPLDLYRIKTNVDIKDPRIAKAIYNPDKLYDILKFKKYKTNDLITQEQDKLFDILKIKKYKTNDLTTINDLTTTNELTTVYCVNTQTHELVLPPISSFAFNENLTFQTYIKKCIDWLDPIHYRATQPDLLKEKIYVALNMQFNSDGTNFFVFKSKMLAEVWDWLYICVLAPETFCFMFALYNVCKAALLYYYYSQYTKEISHVLTPIIYRGISFKMLTTLQSQLYFILLLFINPVIFDRVMVMCSGLLMSHGFISFFKITCVIFFLVIIRYIITYSNFLSYIIAIETYCLISFMILFSLLLFASNNLVLTLVLFEAIFFCIIPLMSSAYMHINKNWDFNYELQITKSSYKALLVYYNQLQPITNLFSSLSVYGTMQYFIYNAFFLGIYIFGLTFLFFFSKSFSYMDLFTILLQGSTYGYSSLIVFSFFCILSMICFKMGIVPYHGWMLSVFSQINIVPLMLLLLPFKLAIFSTGLRLCYGVLHPYLFLFQPILFIMAFASMIFGAFGMFVQLDIRKFLLFSTINHSGYILLGMSSGTILGIKATVFYILIYLISTLGFLVFIGSTLNIKTNKPLTNFLELASCSNLTIFPFLVFFIILLSMAGIPPFAGFWSKLFIIDALFSFGVLGWIGILIIILTSTLTVVGYLRVIKFFFIDNTLTTKVVLKSYTLYSLRVMGFVCFFLIFFLFFYFGYYFLYRDTDFRKIYFFFRLVL